MALATVTPSGGPSGLTTYEPTASKVGWHLITYANGDTAVVRWTGSDWAWGSLAAPLSAVDSVTYLGASIADFTQNTAGIRRWVNAIGQLPADVQTAMMKEIDVGVLGLQGQPVLVDATGAPTGGSSGSVGSEATPVNIIPSPIPPTAGNSHLSVPSLTSLFGNLSLWKGIGLVLAGAGLLIFAALQLKNGL